LEAGTDTEHVSDFSFSTPPRTMFVRRFILKLLALTALLGGSSLAMAEWSELAKEEEAAYYFDKKSVMPVHVSRYAWILTDLPKSDKTPTGETFQSYMLRVRLYCKTDMVVRLNVSYYEKPMGKGREVSSEDLQEWRNREAPVRPNTYMAALKKEVCSPKGAAG
jgi:hypothetical protein